MKHLGRFHSNRSGQILTSVIVFMTFGLIIVAMSGILTIINMQSTAKSIEGARALSYAEAGAEEAIIRLIRDPTYDPDNAAGSFILDTAAVVSIDVTGNATEKTVVSTAVCNGFTRKVQIVLNFDVQGKASLTSWRQII